MDEPSKLSQRTVNALAYVISGDKPSGVPQPVSPYRRGRDIVEFFNEFGSEDGGIVGSRLQYAKDKLRELEETPQFLCIIEAALDPLHFHEHHGAMDPPRASGDAFLREALDYLEPYLARDGYVVKREGDECRVSQAGKDAAPVAESDQSRPRGDLTDEQARILTFIAEGKTTDLVGVSGFEVRKKLGRKVDLEPLLGTFIERTGTTPNERYEPTIAGVRVTPVWDRLTHAMGVALTFMKRALDDDPKRELFTWEDLLGAVGTLEFGALRMALPLFGFHVPVRGATTLTWARGDDIEDVLECETPDDILALRERQWERQRPLREQQEQMARYIEQQRQGQRQGWQAASQPQEESLVGNTAFVIQGHDRVAVDALEDLLRRLGLSVTTWEGSMRLAGDPSASNREAFEAGIAAATVVVALFTPDDVAQPRPSMETGASRWQPRPNVILETGWALGWARAMKSSKVFIVEVGMTHNISDLDGTNTVRMGAQPSVTALNRLASRLELAGAVLDRSDDRWNEPTRYPALFRAEPVHETKTPPPAEKRSPPKVPSTQLRAKQTRQRILADAYQAYMKDPGTQIVYRRPEDYPGELVDIARETHWLEDRGWVRGDYTADNTITHVRLTPRGRDKVEADEELMRSIEGSDGGPAPTADTPAEKKSLDNKLRVREYADGMWSVDVLDLDDNVLHSETGFTSKDDAKTAGAQWAAKEAAKKQLRDLVRGKPGWTTSED